MYLQLQPGYVLINTLLKARVSASIVMIPVHCDRRAHFDVVSSATVHETDRCLCGSMSVVSWHTQSGRMQVAQLLAQTFELRGQAGLAATYRGPVCSCVHQV